MTVGGEAMIKFDSAEYWQVKTWDRFKEIKVVPPRVRDEFTLQENSTIDKILLLSRDQDSLSILDLACGTGRISDSILKLLPNKAHIVLADFNPRTLDKARAHLNNHSDLEFCCVNAYDIGRKFRKEFDVVVCLDFLHHVSRLELLLAEISGALMPSGILIGNVLAAETYREWDRIKYGILKSSRRRVLNNISKSIYDISPRPVKKLIRLSGLARIEPLSKGELVRYLGICFEYLEITSTYYHWFSVMRRRQLESRN